MSGAFSILGEMDIGGDGDSASVDLQIDDRKGDRVLLTVGDEQRTTEVSLKISEALRLAGLLMEASNRLLEAESERAPAESTA